MSNSKKLRLDLPLVLPDVSEAHDRCVLRLTDTLKGRNGIDEVHIVDIESGAPQLCVHYDPDSMTLGRVRELVQSVGAEISSQYAHLAFRANGSLLARTARRIAEELRRVPGVIEADVAASGSLRIEYDRSKVSQQELIEALGSLGISGEVVPWSVPSPRPAAAVQELPAAANDTVVDEVKKDAHDHAAHKGHEHSERDKNHSGHGHGEAGGHAGHDHKEGLLGEKTELIFALLSGALLLIGWLISKGDFAAPWVPTALYVCAYFFGGYFTVKEAFENLRARRFEIDTLMLVAAAGAAALGEWAEGALLLFLFSFGHSLEHYAMGRARRAIEALAKLAPETALLRRDGSTKEVPLAELEVGDVVVVKPNERLPADGVVVVGTR